MTRLVDWGLSISIVKLNRFVSRTVALLEEAVTVRSEGEMNSRVRALESTLPSLVTPRA